MSLEVTLQGHEYIKTAKQEDRYIQPLDILSSMKFRLEICATKLQERRGVGWGAPAGHRVLSKFITLWALECM